MLLLHCDISAVEEELVTNVGVSSNEVTGISLSVWQNLGPAHTSRLSTCRK